MSNTNNSLGTEHFFWDKEEKIFSQEISVLSHINDVFKNKVPKLFTLVSNRTGVVLSMIFSHTEYDENNDVISWTFKPKTNEPFELIVWND